MLTPTKILNLFAAQSAPDTGIESEYSAMNTNKMASSSCVRRLAGGQSDVVGLSSAAQVMMEGDKLVS